jgi:hypothetical protein
MYLRRSSACSGWEETTPCHLATACNPDLVQASGCWGGGKADAGALQSRHLRMGAASAEK